MADDTFPECPICDAAREKAIREGGRYQLCFDCRTKMKEKEEDDRKRKAGQ